MILALPLGEVRLADLVVAPPANIEGLSSAGFDVMSFANNHHMDAGDDAFFSTLGTWTQGNYEIGQITDSAPISQYGCKGGREPLGKSSELCIPEFEDKLAASDKNTNRDDYIKAMADPRSNLPERLRGEAQLLAGYCAAVAGDRNGAGLAAALAREEGLEADLPLAVLAGVADDTKPRLALPKRIGP